MMDVLSTSRHFSPSGHTRRITRTSSFRVQVSSDRAHTIAEWLRRLYWFAPPPLYRMVIAAIGLGERTKRQHH